MNYIIVDLDGTLCDCAHRLSYVINKPKMWNIFFSKIPQDTIIEKVRDKIKDYAENGKIIFLTARPKKTKKDTIEWLSKHGYSEYLLFMRNSNDFRKDVIVKEEIYDKYIYDIFQVDYVIDDKEDILSMFEKKGLTIINPVLL